MPQLSLLLLNSARRWIGEAAHTLALAEGLHQRGHRVRIGVRHGCELEQRALDAKMPILPLRLNSRFNPADDLRDLLDLRRTIHEEKVDLIHANRGKDHWHAVAARMVSPGHIPVIRARHVVTPVHNHLLNRWLYRRATDGVLCVSGAARDSFGPLIKLIRNQRVILSSVDSKCFCPELRRDEVRQRLGCTPETLLIGLVGRIQRVKGQRYFLDAAAQVSREVPNARFLLAGRGNPQQVEALLSHADSVGLPRERIEMLGIVNDLPSIMAAFDIGAISSIGSEGSSRVALEYMASGLPVVATSVGGIPELVTDGVQGFLVKPRHAQEQAEKIIQLANSDTLRTKMGQAGREVTSERFSSGRWLDDVEAFYLDTIAQVS